MTAPEEHQDRNDDTTLSFEASKSGVKLRLPEKLFRYIGPKAITWSILMISAAVALYVIAKGAALVIGGFHAQPKYRSPHPSDAGDGMGNFLPYRRSTAPGVSFWV